MTDPQPRPLERRDYTLDSALVLLRGLGIPEPRAVSRAQGGHTSQVWKLTPRSGPELFAKASFPRRGTPLFPNLPSQEWQAMLHLGGSGVAPFPVGKIDLPDGGALLVSQAAPRGKDLSASALADLLARIHGTAPWFGLKRQDTTARAIIAHGEDMLGRDKIPKWLLRLKPRITACDPAPLRLIHRDLVPANVAVATDGHAVALDWQCPALGDPCEDLAHATSPAMQSLTETHPMLGIEDVVEAYPDATIRARFYRVEAAYRWRMACYCLWQVRNGNTLYQAALELECAALDQVYQRSNEHR
jgi:hypothetical protein